jgi:hypothetical protein
VATALLGWDAEFQPPEARIYDLGVLREPIAFETDPDDPIEDVKVTMLRLTPINTTAERITLESMRASERHIWAQAEERLGPNALQSDYNITQARLVCRYRSPSSNRLRTLNITITHPHRCNLKDQLEIERVLANKYLPKWRLTAA